MHEAVVDRVGLPSIVTLMEDQPELCNERRDQRSIEQRMYALLGRPPTRSQLKELCAAPDPHSSVVALRQSTGSGAFRIGGVPDARDLAYVDSAVLKDDVWRIRGFIDPDHGDRSPWEFGHHLGLERREWVDPGAYAITHEVHQRRGPFTRPEGIRSRDDVAVVDTKQDPSSGCVRERCDGLDQFEGLLLADSSLVLDEQRLAETEHPLDIVERQLVESTCTERPKRHGLRTLDGKQDGDQSSGPKTIPIAGRCAEPAIPPLGKEHLSGIAWAMVPRSPMRSPRPAAGGKMQSSRAASSATRLSPKRSWRQDGQAAFVHAASIYALS